MSQPDYTIKLYPEDAPLERHDGRYRAELLRGDRVIQRESVDWPGKEGVAGTLAFMASLVAHERARRTRQEEKP